jgi:MFS family permease
MMLWGLGLGAQGSIMKAALADLVPKEQRGTGYGIFHTGFGLLWFLGSALMGILYEISLGSLVAFSVIMQLLAIPVFLLISKELGLVRR